MPVCITTPQQEWGDVGCWAVKKTSSDVLTVVEKSCVMVYLGMDSASGGYSEDRQYVKGDWEDSTTGLGKGLDNPSMPSIILRA